MKREWTKKIWLKPFVLLCTTALGLTASAATYTWTGGGTANDDGSYNWNDTANWSWDGEGDLVAPTTSDTVVIGTGDAVTIKGAESEIGDTVVNRAVTLTGSFKFAYKTISSENDSVLTLSALTFKSSGGNTGTISTKVVVSGNVHNNSNSTLHFTGASVSGDSGASFTSPTGDNYSGFDFNKCDLSNFQGTISGCSRANGTRDYTEITPPDDTTIDGGSAAAVWNLGYRDNNGTSVLKTSNRTYSFGALNSLASGFSLRSLSGVILKIGAREDQTSTLVISHVGSNNTIEKVGSGELRFASQSVTLNATAGTVTLTDSTKVPAAINVSGGATLAFANDFTSASALVSAVEDSENSDPVTISVASGKTVVLADTFANASGFSKAGDGYLELTAAPAWTGKTAVTGIGTLTVPAGSVLTLDDETTESLTLGDGRVLVYSKTAVNVWTGEANDNNWTTANNWSKGTVPATDVSTEVVLIPDGADTTITCNSTSTCRSGQLTILRNVTLTGNGGGLKVDAISGTGTLTAAAGKGKTFYFSAGSGFTVNCNLCVEDTLNCGSSVLTLYGDLSGAGTIVHGSSNQPGFHFYGSTEEFSGSYTGGTRNNGDRDGTRFSGNARGSANASWKIGNDDSGNYKSPFRAGDGATYEFGTLDTVFSGNNRLTMYVTHASTGDTFAKNVTLKIGAKENGTSNVGGTLYNGTTGDTENPNKIVKVGDTSTLNLTLTTANGAVEAEAGTLNLNGSNAPVSLSITGKGATVVVADTVTVASGEEDNPDTTEVDESKAAFVPVLSDALTAAYCKLLATSGEGVMIYTLDAVAQVGENTYPTIADAVAAATGDDKAITLLQSTAEPVVLTTAGQTFTLGEFTSGAVSAVAGLGLSESEGVYTAVDNTASVWQGDAAGADWTVGSNWSTGYAPDSGTAVTIPAEGAPWVIYLGGDAHAKSIEVLGDVKFQRDAALTGWGNVVVQENVTTGETPSTVTLHSANIFGVSGGTKTIDCNIVATSYEASRYSGFATGAFVLNGTLTASGAFRPAGDTITFNGAVMLNDGGSIDRTLTGASGEPVFNGTVTLNGASAIKTYAVTYNNAVTMGDDAVISIGSSTQNYGSDFTLNGSGTIIGDTKAPGSDLQTCLRGNRTVNNIKNSWTGTCELKNIAFGSTQVNLNNYGNSKSTVRVNGITSGYPAYNSNSTAKDISSVGTLEIASGGWTTSGTFSSKNWTISSKLTGTGTIAFATGCNNLSTLTFTGDVSEFQGGLSFGSLTSGLPCMVFNSNNGTVDTVSAGQIDVVKGTTLGIGSAGISGTVVGGGTIAGSAYPTTAPTFDSTSWTGEFDIGWTINSGSFDVDRYGTANSVVALKTAMTGGYFPSGASFATTLQLDADMTVNNGYPNTTTTFANITGDKNLAFTANISAVPTFAISKFTDFTGELSTGGNSAVTIGTVAVSSWTLGQKMVDLSDNCNLTTSPGSITVEVNGSSLDGHYLFKATDGDLYVMAASVTIGETTTYYATLEEAAAAAIAADTTFTRVDSAAPTSLPGWSYDKNVFTKVEVAQVGETKYKTLKAALAVENVTDIKLIATCDEPAALAQGQTLTVINSADYTGTFSGSGDLVYNTAPAHAPTLDAEFNGSVKLAFNYAGMTIAPFGNGISTIVLGDLTASNAYLSDGSGSGTGLIASPTVVDGSVTINNGWPLGSADWTSAKVVTFENLKVNGSFKLDSTQSNWNAWRGYYRAKVLDGTGTGSITVADAFSLRVDAVSLSAALAQANIGKRIVPLALEDADTVTSAGGGKLFGPNGVENEAIPVVVNGENVGQLLVYKADGAEGAGLYFDPVALIGTTYYNTLQEAVTAASAINSGKVLLVGSAEGMEATIPAPSAGGRVQFYIAANGNTLGTVEAPDGDYILTTSTDTIAIDSVNYEATKYQLVAAAAAVTVGETRTLYALASLPDAVYAAIAGGLGSSIEFVNGTDGSTYQAALEASGFTYDSETGAWTLTKTPVVEVRYGQLAGTQYLTLAQALADISTTGATLYLLDDITEAVTYTGEVDITIDLAGYSWTVDADCDEVWAAFKNNGVGSTVTFKDSSASGTGTIRCDAGFCIWARLGSVVIESGTYVNDSNDNYAVYVGTTDANIGDNDAPTATITGGTFTNENTDPYKYNSELSSLNLNVYNYNATTATKMSTSLIQVSGGTFTADPANGDDNMGGSFLADGYSSYEDTEGTWTVDRTRLFKLHTDTTYYYTVAEAVSGANGALVDQLVSVDAVELGEGESLMVLAASGIEIGTLTLNGGTFTTDYSYAGTIGAIAVGANGGSMEVRSQTSFSGALTGSGDLTVEFPYNGRGLRIYGNCEGYSGTLTLKSEQASTWARGFMSGSSTSAAMSFAVDSGDATELVDFVAKFEANATFNAMSTTANSVTHLNGKSVTLAGAGASTLNGTLTSGTITKSGEGKLTLGSTFATTDNLTLNVGAGTLAVAATSAQLSSNGVVVSNVTVSISSGVTIELPDGAADSLNQNGDVTLLAAKDITVTVADVTVPSGWSLSTTTRTVGGVSCKVLKLHKDAGIDPSDPTSSQTVTPTAEEIEAAGSAEAAAIAKAAVTVPAGVSGVDAATYKTYFTLAAASGEAGAYTVTIAGLSDEVVVEPVEASAIAALQSEAVGDQVTVTVKPGLYYGFVSGDSPTLDDPAEYTLATVETMSFTKPSGSGKGFVKVVISPAPKASQP